ncbi:hypothetical protein TNCV_3967571 [Trichonephila clavipes]|nr:hypothetical protein TNCV_3967571 [Trichonephila clavipes]
MNLPCRKIIHDGPHVAPEPRVFEITTRSRLADLTSTLHEIPYVLEDSSRQSCARWRRTEGFVKTDPE